MVELTNERQQNHSDRCHPSQAESDIDKQLAMPSQEASSPFVVSSPATFRVLIVDDDPLILRLLERWSTNAGYHVSQANNGEVALRMIQEVLPHIVITDWEMPKLTGPELCRELRKLKLPHYVYTLILTSHNEIPNLVQGLNEGADDFLGKPIREPELIARLGAATRILTAQRQLQEMAQRDSLTGLLTQRAFYELLAKELEISRRTSRPLSCAMVDLDFFKRINDIHGHQAGDHVLKTTADVLLRSCRASDIVCRYGGEEFCVIFPDTPEHCAARWAGRFRAELNAVPFRLGEATLFLTCSIGLTQLRDDILTPEELIDRADQALLCAKRAGRDRVVRYSDVAHGGDLPVNDVEQQSDLFQGIFAYHVMSPVVAPLYMEETVDQAAEFFLRSRISSAPVVDRQGQLVGIISEKDLLSAITSLEGWSRPISELMRPHVITYPANTPVRVIYEFLCRVSIRRVIVTDQGSPVGIISRGTLLRWFRNLVASKQSASENRKASNDSAQARHTILQDSLAGILTEGQRLQRTLEQNPPDLVPFVVGAASRIQDLATEMLAFANVAGNEVTGSNLSLGAFSD
ncbi:MAG: diguanylate cyclase [Thermogutta sp.]